MPPNALTEPWPTKKQPETAQKGALKDDVSDRDRKGRVTPLSMQRTGNSVGHRSSPRLVVLDLVLLAINFSMPEQIVDCFVILQEPFSVLRRRS